MKRAAGREGELFYLRFVRKREFVRRELIDHTIPLNAICSVTVGTPNPGPRSAPVHSVESAGVLSFRPADEHVLTLAFDGEVSKQVADLRPEAPLVLRGSGTSAQRAQ